MRYLSFSFFIMVAATVLCYYLIPRKWNCRYIVLFLGSLYFYCSFDFRFLFFLLFTAISSFFCGLLFSKSGKKKLLLFLCVAIIIAVWFAIKVLPWVLMISNHILHLLGVRKTVSLFSELIVPIGISYYTLQAISYLVDVYKGKTAPEKNIIKYFLFISFFPAIVQGPISRYDELMPQLVNNNPFSIENMRRGFLLILIGLVKKLVIADRLGTFVNQCFTSYTTLTGFTLLVGAISYSIQLYTDFSGCVDICRGVAFFFNIELINNFNRPYLATSIRDFWTKWHISLSRWLKDYVYIPLGGSRKGTNRKYINLIITFLVSGLWHGAGLNFFIWGLLHALYQIIGQMTAGARQTIKKHIGVEENSKSEQLYKIIITFSLVTFAWIFFRASSFTMGLQYIHRIISDFNLRLGFFELMQYNRYALVVFLNLLFLLLFEAVTSSQDEAVTGVLQIHILFRWGFYLLLIFDILLFGVYGTGYDMSGFLYGGF